MAAQKEKSRLLSTNVFSVIEPEGRTIFDKVELNPFTTGNPFLGTKLLGFSIGRGSGALKGLTVRSLCGLLALDS